MIPGWRAKIGLLVPSTNIIVEPEFHKLVPRGISVHTSRMKRATDVSPIVALEFMAKHSIEAAELLADCGVDVVLFACTSASMLQQGQGPGNLVEALERTCKVPVITCASALVSALRAIHARRVALLAPYVQEINEAEQKFLESEGIEVVSVKGYGIADSRDFVKIPPETLFADAKKLGAEPNVEAVVLSCANIRSGEIVEPLEEDLGKPVITSITASLWAVLRAIQVRTQISGCGLLLRE